MKTEAPGRNAVIGWLIAAFMVPPIVWLGAGTYLNIWNGAELLRIILSPFIWVYVLLFLVLAYRSISKNLNIVSEIMNTDNPGREQTFRGIRAVNRIPVLFLILMSIYCVVGPNVALLGQTVSSNPFLDSFEYILAELLGIPLILLFTIPFFIKMIVALERFSKDLDVSGEKRFLTLRHKLIISFLLNTIGAILTLVITGLAILYKGDAETLLAVFSRKFIVTGSVVLFISVVNLILAEAQITRPVQELTIGLSKVFTVFSRGDGRLETGLNISSRDELGYISRRFNTFVEALNRIIHQIQGLAVASNERFAVLEKLSMEAQLSVNQARESSREIISMMKSIQESGTEYLNFSQEVKDFIRSTGERIEVQDESTRNITLENQKIAGELSQEISKSRNRLKFVQNSEQASAEARSSIQNSVNQMLNVQNSSKQILDILNVINDIAERTNLLAMNAAIEAAHAGDSGRGFAVVAGEIRSLAEMTGENSRSIDTSIKKIVEEINNSEQQARETSKKMEESFNELHNLTEGLQKTIQVTSDLGEKTSAMDKHLLDLSKGSESIRESARSSDTRMESISSGLQNLVNRLRDVELTVEKVNSVIAGQSEVFSRTAESIDSNSKDIQSLYDTVKGFS